MKYIIRPIEAKDSPDINELRRMPGVMENILSYPSERVARQENFFSNLTDNSHTFVAETTLADGTQKVIALAVLTTNSRPRTKHVGQIALMVSIEYHNQGIGKALMQTLLDVADNWLKLIRVELSVFTANEKAIHLYEKFGFEKEGIMRKNGVRNGDYADEYMMARISL